LAAAFEVFEWVFLASREVWGGNEPRLAVAGRGQHHFGFW
jgi:hypothetical protein